MNKRAVGADKEALAVKYLQKNGLVILEKNYRNRFGEIDIIARQNNIIVFVEVKYRKTASLGHPEEAVNYKKAKTICKIANYYIVCNRIPAHIQCRFDVVAIEGCDIRWHQNAFPYIP